MIYIYDLSALEFLKQKNLLSGLFLGHDSIAWGFLSFLVIFSLSIPTIVALIRRHSTVLFIFIVSIAFLPFQFSRAPSAVQLYGFELLLFLLLSIWSFFGPKKKQNNFVEEESIGLRNYFRGARERFPVIYSFTLFFMKLLMTCLCSIFNANSALLIRINYYSEYTYWHDYSYDPNWPLFIFLRDYFSSYAFMWGIIFAGFFWIGLLLKHIFSKERKHPLITLFLQTYVIFFLLLFFIVIDQEFLYSFMKLRYIGGFIFVFLPFVFASPTILASLRRHPYSSRIFLLNILCFLLLSPDIFEWIDRMFKRVAEMSRDFYLPGMFIVGTSWLALLLWSFSGTGRRLENNDNRTPGPTVSAPSSSKAFPAVKRAD